MDPMGILAALGDKGLAAVGAGIVAYSWFTNWLVGGGIFSLMGTIFWNFFMIGLTSIVVGFIYLLGMWFTSLYYSAGPGNWEEHLTVKDPKFAQEYKGKKIPMDIFISAYIDQKVDFKKDLLETLRDVRYEIFRMCFTLNHLPFLVQKFVPMVLSHTKQIDEKEIRDVYDRGNDFYRFFLGPSMLYTSGVFESEQDTLEQAQENKMTIACKKIHLDKEKSEKVLDIGCGWGTFACFAADKFGADVTGITISKEGFNYAVQQAKDKKLEDKVHFKCVDYRDIPNEKYDKITAFEMAEHVGVKNFQLFLSIVKDRLDDDGIFYMQVAGLRRHWIFEDLIWGLFMNKYIFPGADASCPLNWYVGQCEAAGFEVRSVETIGIHYCLTISRWYDNWKSNRTDVIAKYGEYWYRLWLMFLGWAVVATKQGTAACYQIVMHKNTGTFEREAFIGKRV